MIAEQKKGMMMNRVMAAVFFAWCSSMCVADEAAAFYPEAPVPFMGDWVGKWTVGEDKQPDIAAQVIGRGNDTFEIVLQRALYRRAPVFATVTGRVEGDALLFDDGYFFGEIRGDTFTGGRRDDKNSAFTLHPHTQPSPTLGAPPPPEAMVLFDGSGFDQWKRFPRGASWEILEGGILQAHPNLGYIITERNFGDCRLHLEFRTPYLPKERDQGRANSGVFLQHYFEVQILDSYGLPGYWNDCGAIYQISAPYVNLCLPPLQWQAFDIDFRAARYDDAGNLLEKPRMTVLHNGVAVQKDHEIPHGTSFDARKPPVNPPDRPMPIRIQAHKNRVQFRNIWIVDTSDENKK
jgi:hypothetical protein